MVGRGERGRRSVLMKRNDEQFGEILFEGRERRDRLVNPGPPHIMVVCHQWVVQ
jgi:hypothetical protein